MPDAEPKSREETLFAALRGAFAMRAQAYGHMFDVLRERYGTEAALAVGQEATRRLGESMAEAYRPHGPADLAGLCETFLARIPERDALFAPTIERCDDQELVIRFARCPLKETWVAAGRTPEDVRLLCAFAAAIDGGLFEGAGFIFAGETWQPGREGCCRLVVRPGAGS
jgi:hypothetical protein